MQINVLAIGEKMPAWVSLGYQEYATRLKGSCSLVLHEIAAEKRSKHSDIKRICDTESNKLLAAIPKRTIKIALDVKGQQWSTEQLAHKMEHWMMSGNDIALLIGGPEGLSKHCINEMDQLWSLSALTYPHPLVRIILAEQLYRAHSIINHHPYHRA